MIPSSPPSPPNTKAAPSNAAFKSGDYVRYDNGHDYSFGIVTSAGPQTFAVTWESGIKRCYARGYYLVSGVPPTSQDIARECLERAGLIALQEISAKRVAELEAHLREAQARQSVAEAFVGILTRDYEDRSLLDRCWAAETALANVLRALDEGSPVDIVEIRAALIGKGPDVIIKVCAERTGLLALVAQLEGRRVAGIKTEALIEEYRRARTVCREAANRFCAAEEGTPSYHAALNTARATSQHQKECREALITHVVNWAGAPDRSGPETSMPDLECEADDALEFYFSDM